MEIVIANTLRVHNPTAELVQWCSKNLRLENPDYAKKQRMHFWLGNTPQYIWLYERDGGDLILPFGVLRELPENVRQYALFSTAFAPAPAIDYGAPIPLYPYQETAVQTAHNARYGLLQSPAGSGKTQMGIALVKRWGKRALWLTHTVDLLNQSKERALRYMDESLIGTITGGKVEIGSGITFATIQTMSKLDLAAYRDTWDLVIVDECHRCAGSPTAVTQFYKVLNALAARHKYGLSATVHRSDGMIAATYALLGRVIHTVPDEAVRGHIMRVGIRPINTGVQLDSAALNTDGTLNYTRLITSLCENDLRTDKIAAQICVEYQHSSLILSERLEHLQAIMDTLPEPMQAQAVLISGKMTSKRQKAEREQAIEDMRTGKKRYLFATYSLAKEGLDIPCLERLYLATPQKDYAVITQSIGRVARVCEGKADPICYDFVDDIRYLVNSYKKRCTTYRKNGCYFI